MRGALLAVLAGATGTAALAAAPAGPHTTAWTLRAAAAPPPSAPARQLRAARATAPELAVRREALRRAAAEGRLTADALMRPGASLGVRKRVDGRWLPARGAPSRRADILRRGALEELTRGELARAAGPAGEAATVRGQDTVRVLVLRVDFLTDRAGPQTTGDGRFDLSPPDTIHVPVDPTPHGRAFYEAHAEAMARYFETTTAGRLVVEWDVYPKADTAYHTTDMADFGPWRLSPDVFDAAYRMFQAFLAAADTQDTSIPWDTFDRVMIFHAGSDLQSDVRLDSPLDIPTFTIGLDDSLAIPVQDSTTRIYAAAILPETANQDGYFAALNAVVVHENGHNIFGWRDVYDVYSGFPVCGEWSLMDTGNLTGSTVQVGDSAQARTFFAIGLLPPLADPYQRHLVYDDVPREDPPVWGAVDSLGPPQLTERVLRVPISSEEYLLLENRQNDLNGDGQIVLARDPATGVILGPGRADSLEYDYLLPGSGVLAWHIDASVVDFAPPGRRVDPFYTLNGNRARRGVQIFEADALDDLGDPGSPFLLGSPLDPYFLPNNGRLARHTRPPLVTNSGTDPHVAVDVLDTLRLTMRVRASRDWQAPGWPVVVRPARHGLDPLVFAFPGDEARTVVYAAGDSAIHARTAQGAAAGGDGDVLWRAPASLSPVAAWGDPAAGAPVVAVYPDPAVVRDSLPIAGDGSRVVALDGLGDPLPGFPVAVPGGLGGRPEWVTAGPLVLDLDGAGASEPAVFVGTASGRIYQVSRLGGIGEVRGFWLTLQGPGVAAGGPILSLAGFARPPRALVAAADSAGTVALLLEGPVPASTSAAGAARPGRPGWEPLLAWVEMNVGAGGQLQRNLGPVPATPDLPQLVVADAATGEGVVYSAEQVWAELRGVDAPLAGGLAAGDVDGDGYHEVVLLTRDGRVGFWNLSGSSVPGWPRDLEPEPFPGLAAPLVASLGATPALDVLVATGSGRLHALGQDRVRPEGWPLATGAGQRAHPALLDLEGDGSLELLIADADSLLYAFDLPEAPAGLAAWPMWGHDPGRTFSLVTPPETGAPGAGTPLVQGSIACYPNPARRRPVTVSYRLNEPAAVTLTLFDPSGRQVDEIRQQGMASDNALVWDVEGRAPGLYLGRLVIQGNTRQEKHLLHIGVIR